MIHAVLAFWLWHPLGTCALPGTPHNVVEGCKGYNFFSGIGSDFSEITLVVSVLAILVAVYRRLNCHYGGTKILPPDGCHRIGRYSHGHFELCHRHHPHVPDDGKITTDHIIAQNRKGELQKEIDQWRKRL